MRTGSVGARVVLALLATAGCTDSSMNLPDTGPGGGSATSSTGGGAGDGGDGGDGQLGDPALGRLGAHYDDRNNLTIAVRSDAAERMEVWLYDVAVAGAERLVRELVRDGDRWVGWVSATELEQNGLAGQLYYGLRAWGPNWPYDADWQPGSTAGWVADVDGSGNRYNPNKLLIDPYARELSHDPTRAGFTDFRVFTSGADHRADDTAAMAPKGLVLRDEGIPVSPPLQRPLADHVIYEVHVRGFTMADPTVPEAIRGTYAGAAMRAGYLADLGVTTIELLPLHETQNDQNDLTPDSTSGDNYWGYSSLSYFAPDRRYAADRSPGGPTRELKAMVAAFHQEGISVLVDVVYNHTAEGGSWDAEGNVAPILSWRGIDNAGYYQLAGDPRFYQNDNGVGPNLATTTELARSMVVDSLRYWHEEIGVDGFRFDLASVLANGCETGCFSFDGDDPNGILARARAQLPQAILIAEPWGTGAGTYQIGNFPSGWAEWNGPFRDLVRRDQNRDMVATVTPGELANGLSGSWDLFGDDGRMPWHAINFVTAHDGLTLRDLYSCNGKNNEQPWPYGPSNGGSNDNLAWDHGGDAEAQEHAARTGLALLMLSAGVPMILGGDEMYRTQKCNNNTYNLDSVGSWLRWEDRDERPQFAHFARELMRFRSAHAALRPAAYRGSSDGDDNGLAPVTWFDDKGQIATANYLDNSGNHFIGHRLDGEEAGDSVRSIYIGYNGWTQGLNITLPTPGPGNRWFLVSDTHPWLKADGNFLAPGEEAAHTDANYQLGPRSVLILVEHP